MQKFFQKSKDPLYKRMFTHMTLEKTFVDSTKDGVKKARSENYAYITEQPYLEYYNQQKPCNTRLLDNLLQTQGYGIGLQQNSPYTNKISVAILGVSDSLCCKTSSEHHDFHFWKCFDQQTKTNHYPITVQIWSHVT